MLLWFQSCREIDSCCSRTQCPKASLVPTGPIILKKKDSACFWSFGVCYTRHVYERSEQNQKEDQQEVEEEERKIHEYMNTKNK